ncbi:TIR domain-containing protein [Phenylobacterium sp. 20VBR1]|uniref:TIR domain-containing protein n=1 Tax=Phenylobacterium glaciei TaxID=2803784 RepID=A0A941CZF5_9CAUL|nr:TIR domain-containing protein [Phenylobacterium glaciei]MBR7619445.1 TIR domain-containing protein [Phenylobacterium glaciei]
MSPSSTGIDLGLGIRYSSCVQDWGRPLPDIFLSYSREDQAVARRFAEAFAGQGFDVWWDATLKSGEAYDEVTETALRMARAVVVLWSPRSVMSRWVRAEATLADRNKTLVPCMIEPCERPLMFELTQTAELAHWQGGAEDRVWQGFVADVRRLVERNGAAFAAAQTLAEIVPDPAPPRETLLAVLPFDNLSSDAEMAFFSDGVSEDILGRITQGSTLKVIGRTSSFQFRGLDKPKAAQVLNATHILDGSIRRAGAKVRIAAHLTETNSQTTVWSDKFDRSLDDIFAVQDEISEAIAKALNTAFLPRKTSAIDPIAYDLYLRAKSSSPDPAEAARNIATLETVTRLAPDFADGWASLAHARMATITLLPYAGRARHRALAEAELARCLALDPDSVMGADANWAMCDPFGDYLAQEKIMRRVSEIGTNSANAQFGLGYHLEGVGRNREAVKASRRLRDLDPKNSVADALYVQSLWRAGQFAEGRAAMEVHLQFWPDNHHTAALLILACAHQQDWAAVDALLDPQRLEQFPLREHSTVIGVVGLLRSPTPETRRIILDMVKNRVAKTGHLDHVALVWPAELGFADEAFDVLDAAKLGPAGEPGDTLGINAYRSHMVFPAAYTQLRANPRFVKLCARLGLVEYWHETQQWPDCAETVPYDFKGECEKYRDYPKDKFVA